ncbi:MAG TPA: DNA polymerase III subunit gamma/tau [Lacipirellulaceae bacterium]|nr:DNA polymerase III subunit gamma/tau [Lacipirellulaceae bacterium]
MSDSTTSSGLADQSASGRYVVIARRYRPQTFDELVGQEHVARALQQAITSDRVGHAYLFTGARGVGKTSAARIFAKALNCVRGPTPTPCNECDVCLSVSTGDDVDVLEIDGASNRGIDEIRQLRQNVAVRPSRVRYKIYIIDEVHMLTKEAFNALLKTLEEPPEHVKFIFATTEPQKIPITILSRCQRFDFAGISPSAIEQRLAQIASAEGVTVEAEALQILASRAAGSMRDSQSLLEQLLAVGHERITAVDVTDLLGIAPAERLSGLVGHLVARDAAAALAELDAIVRDGVEVGLLLDQLVGYFRDVMAVNVGCPPQQMLYALPSQAQEVAQVGNKLGLSMILAIGQILDHSAARMRLTMHGRTLVEMAIVRICQLDELDDIAALVAELRGDGQERIVRGTSDVASNETYGRRSGGVARAAPSAASLVPSSERAAPNSASSAPNSASRRSNSRRSAENSSLAGDEAQDADVESPTSDSVIAQWRRALTEQNESPPSSPPRESLRDKKAKVAEQPFVRQAMELFEVPSGQFRYTPPEADGN